MERRSSTLVTGAVITAIVVTLLGAYGLLYWYRAPYATGSSVRREGGHAWFVLHFENVVEEWLFLPGEWLHQQIAFESFVERSNANRAPQRPSF